MLVTSRVEPLPVVPRPGQSREIRLSMHKGAMLVHCTDAPKFPEVLGTLQMLDWEITYTDFRYMIQTQEGVILDGRGNVPLKVGEVLITARFPLLILSKRSSASSSVRPGLRPVMTFSLSQDSRLYHCAEFNKRFYPLA